jgi:lantibiotic modifying enzyme
MIGLHSSLPLGAVEEVLWDFLAANYRTGSEQALFPIDPFGVETNSLGFGFGAAGIAYALRNADRNLPDLAEQRYLEELKKKDLTKLAPGLLVGTAGMAWERFAAGDVDMGLRLLQSSNESPLRHSHHSLFLGIAGIGMTNLAAYQATGAVEHLAVARSYGQTLKQTGTQTARGVCWTDDGATRIGYGYGQSGVALFLLRLSQATCEPQWRELGQQALAYDLSWAGQVEDGIKTFPAATDVEHTFEPYIEEGTSGIAKVAIRYGMQEVATDLLLDAYRKYSGFSGLLYGLAGFVDVLVDAYRYFGERSFLEMAERPLEGLVDLYLFESKKGHAVPGDGLFRVSTDYATGVAGVAHAIHRRIGLSGDDLCLDKMDIGPSPA